MKKLCICFFIICCCIFLSAAMPVHADDADNFSFTLLSDNSIAVTCINTDIQSVDIPSEINGYLVTALADGCFAECFYLESVSIPETVTSIGEYAFYGCSCLQYIEIPASVTSIGTYAFDTTEDMTEFIVDENNPSYQAHEGVLYDKAGTTLIKYPESKPDTSYAVLDSCQNIADWALIGSQFLEEINLKQVCTIGEDAFYYCIALKSITIPEGVTELVGATFGCCASLQEVVLPSTIQSLGDNCFYSCVDLQKINLPEGLLKLGTCTFCHCKSLHSLVIPKSLVTVNAYCMGYVYDEDTDDYALQEDFTLYVYNGSAAYKYAYTNHIEYAIIRNDTILYWIFIALVGIIIIILSIAIIKTVRSRRENA